MSPLNITKIAELHWTTIFGGVNNPPDQMDMYSLK